MREKMQSQVDLYNELTRKLEQETSSYSPKELIDLSNSRNQLDQFMMLVEKFDNCKKLIADLRSLSEDPSSGEELLSMAHEELEQTQDTLAEVEHQLLILQLPKDKHDAGAAIIELRPGTGGLEAGLFAMDMYKMYQRYAESKKWTFEPLVLVESDVEGLHEASISIKGENVFGLLKYEIGVHRVQRIPETETLGRVHTSTMTVAVLPEAENIDVELKPQDLRIETKRASGAGGQHVNTTDSAVRILHIPTGLVVSIQDERSQHKNKEKAMKILKARLYNLQRTKYNEERAQNRKLQVGTGERNERIRTYNFQQDRTTDHRIGLTIHGVNEMLEGDNLDHFIESLKEASQAEQLQILLEESTQPLDDHTLKPIGGNPSHRR